MAKLDRLVKRLMHSSLGPMQAKQQRGNDLGPIQTSLAARAQVAAAGKLLRPKA